jgi:hypothetical protein
VGENAVRNGTGRHAKVGGIVLAVCVFVALSPHPAGAVSTIPSAPRSVRMVPGDGRATVRWHPPAHSGGHPITQYEVIPYLDNSPLPTNVFASTATSQVIYGLRNGRSYTFKVAAKNSVGWSRLSARSRDVTIGVPLAPLTPTAVPGNTDATVSWHPPETDNGSAVNSYRVTPFLDGAAQVARTFNSTQTHAVITGLHGGQPYAFEVEAHNRNGWSDPSNTSPTVVVHP